MIVVLVVDDGVRVGRVDAACVDRVPGFRAVSPAHSAAEALGRVRTLPGWISSSWTAICPTRRGWTSSGRCGGAAAERT